jgi:DNA polymerase II small subunit/DNA polymerase delta subunit B
MATGEMGLAVSRVLSQGYQIDPDAFSLLSELSSKGDVEPILRSVIEKKELLKTERVILKSDLDEFVPRDEVYGRIAVDSHDLAADLVVVSNPTDTIRPIEAEDGFKRLFQDRYSHLLEIAKQRPDSKSITSIESGREMREKDYKIAGLVSSRNSRKGGGVELVLDDPTGFRTGVALRQPGHRRCGPWENGAVVREELGPAGYSGEEGDRVVAQGICGDVV